MLIGNNRNENHRHFRNAYCVRLARVRMFKKARTDSYGTHQFIVCTGAVNLLGKNRWQYRETTALFFSPWRNSPLMGQGLLIVEASQSHSDTPQSVGLLWTSDHPDAETST